MGGTGDKLCANVLSLSSKQFAIFEEIEVDWTGEWFPYFQTVSWEQRLAKFD